MIRLFLVTTAAALAVAVPANGEPFTTLDITPETGWGLTDVAAPVPLAETGWGTPGSVDGGWL